MNRAYEYEFRGGINSRDIEDTLLLAALAAEGVFGQTRVLMDASYSTNRKTRIVIIDGTTAVGQMINAVFAIYAAREFGHKAFSVRRLDAEVQV